MTRLEETVKVKGASDQSLKLKFTRHGPIIHEDHANRRAYAVRSVWFEPGAAPYMVSISSMRARVLRRVRERYDALGCPGGQSGLRGHLAATSPGPSPATARSDRAGTGSFRFRATGDTSRAGFYRAGELPHALNPSEGYLATANEQNVPAGWPVKAENIGFEWIEGSRAKRIAEVFAATETHSVQSSCDLQTDVVSLPARRLLALTAKLPSKTPLRQLPR